MKRSAILHSIREIFSLDARSLALFRVVLGLELLYDLAIRAHSLKAFYTDSGLMPRSVLMRNAQLECWPAC